MKTAFPNSSVTAQMLRPLKKLHNWDHTSNNLQQESLDIYARFFFLLRKAHRTVRDSSHTSHGLLSPLPSGRHYHRNSTSRLQDKFLPQAIRLNWTRTSNTTQQQPHMHCTLSVTLTGLWLTIILHPDILFALIHTVLHCKDISTVYSDCCLLLFLFCALCTV